MEEHVRDKSSRFLLFSKWSASKQEIPQSRLCQSGSHNPNPALLFSILRFVSWLESRWPWLCLWGRSRFPKPWGGSNASSMTSSRPPSATGRPRSPEQTPSRHRNTPVWGTEIDVNLWSVGIIGWFYNLYNLTSNKASLFLSAISDVSFRPNK